MKRRDPPRGRTGPETVQGSVGRLPAVVPSLLASLGLAISLYARGFGVGLVGDDYTLLDAALRVPLAELLAGRHGIVGYYRPVSRELYFWLWGHVAGAAPLVYHVVNAVVFLAAAALLFTFLRRWQGPRVAQFGVLAFALFPPVGALLAWISCAQDLIALFWTLAALVLYQSRRFVLSGIAVALAALSKETAAIAAPALALYEWSASGSDRVAVRERLRRLTPAFAGLSVAAVIAIAARATWPAGTAVAVWSPRQMSGAWRLPGDFLSAFVPPSTLEGLGAAARSVPWLVAIVAVLAVLAVPPRRGGDGPGVDRASRRKPASPGAQQGSPGPARERRGRDVFLFGAGLALLGMLPVAVILERWRSYFFSFAALGASVIAGALLARAHPWVARGVLAVAALVCLGSNTVYRAVEAESGPARHPHANYAFFRDNAELSGRLLATFSPHCAALHSVPRVFTVDLPDQQIFETLTGPGLRLTCRDTVARVRPLAAFEASDAAHPFGLLRFDAFAGRFDFELASQGARARLAERFRLAGRDDLAAALLAPLGERGR